MVKEKEIKKEEKKEIKKAATEKVSLKFPIWLYSKDGSVLFKNEKQYLEESKNKKFQDTPFNKG